MWIESCIFSITNFLEVFSSNNFKLLLAGLMSEELHELLAWHSGLKMGREKIQPEDVVAQPFPASSALPPVVFAFLQRSVQSFLNPINTYSGWVVVLKAWGFGDDQHCYDGKKIGKGLLWRSDQGWIVIWKRARTVTGVAMLVRTLTCMSFIWIP